MQHSGNLDHGIWSHHFMANRWGNSVNSDGLYILEAPKIKSDTVSTVSPSISHEVREELLSNVLCIIDHFKTFAFYHERNRLEDFE